MTSQPVEDAVDIRYEGYKVISSMPMDQEQVDTLNNIMENMTDCDLDWWAEPYKPEIAVTVLVRVVTNIIQFNLNKIDFGF